MACSAAARSDSREAARALTSAARLARSADRARFCLSPIRTQNHRYPVGCPHHQRRGTGISPGRDIYRPSARCCRVRRVSADRAARPSPHTRGKPRLLNLGRRIPARDRFATDSPLEGDGFEPSVPLFERVLSALPNGDAGPIGWMGSLSPGRLARRRSLRADPFSTAVSLTARPMVRIRLPPAESPRTFGP